MKKVLVHNEFKTLLEKESTILSRENFRIFGATTAEEMMKIHRSERVDLVIADYHMKEMRGDTFCSAIRGNDALKTVSIIVICPRNKTVIEKCRASGANAVVIRPIDAEELLRRAAALLNVPRRKSLRGVIKITVNAVFQNDSFFSGSLNISTSGMLLETDRMLSQGDRLTCSFVLDRKTTVTGEIVRKEEKGPALYQYGVRFIGLDSKTRAEIEEFIKIQ
ncbi:MAG TPA: response regulator [Thermodesulfovibrionales bacterium]|nr:response regulator [Thermodesulfovibrionales bacterium]